MLLVLVEPLVAVFQEEAVLAKGGVDKPVDEARRQVLPRRVHAAPGPKRWACMRHKRQLPASQTRYSLLLQKQCIHSLEEPKLNQDTSSARRAPTERNPCSTLRPRYQVLSRE